MSDNQIPEPQQTTTDAYVVQPPNPPEPEHPQQTELQEEDFQNLDEIERELAKTLGVSVDPEELDDDEFEEDGDFSPHDNFHSKTFSRSTDSHTYLPSGAVPTVNGKLSVHAAEFWFPESRECKCCKGFKYGCSCAKSGFVSCQETGCVEPANLGKRTASLNVSAPPSSNTSESPRGKVSLPSPINTQGGGIGYCKFEFSPSGCRFGSTCRFKHQSGGLGSNSAESPKGEVRAFCPYFMRGNCDFGDKCRYAHI